jgi:hypothetical protein
LDNALKNTKCGRGAELHGPGGGTKSFQLCLCTHATVAAEAAVATATMK